MPASERTKAVVQKVASSGWFSRIAPKVVPPADKLLSTLSGGRLLLSQRIVPSVSLTTTGARSGEQRTVYLATVPHAGSHYVVASNFGRENHPAWSYNLMKTPEARMTIDGSTIPVTAQLLDEDQKAAVWPELTKVWPPYDRYSERSGRDLRVFRLAATDHP